MQGYVLHSCWRIPVEWVGIEWICMEWIRMNLRIEWIRNDTYWCMFCIHIHCHSCWCIPFEWIRIEWICIEGIRIDRIRVEWICAGWCLLIYIVWHTPTIFWRTLRQNVFPEKTTSYTTECPKHGYLDSSFPGKALMEMNLVGGWTNPVEKYCSKWIISAGRVQNKKSLKHQPSGFIETLWDGRFFFEKKCVWIQPKELKPQVSLLGLQPFPKKKWGVNMFSMCSTFPPLDPNKSHCEKIVGGLILLNYSKRRKPCWLRCSGIKSENHGC